MIEDCENSVVVSVVLEDVNTVYLLRAWSDKCPNTTCDLCLDSL